MQGSTRDLGAALNELAAVIDARKGADPKASYTASLFAAGRERCARKFGEEAVEAVIAGATGDGKALAEEAGDALYHLLILLAANDVAPGDVAEALAARKGVSGHDEKASRGK
jgi:phosphoribosyl-ATP pyrophosphohydrolase